MEDNPSYFSFCDPYEYYLAKHGRDLEYVVNYFKI